MKNPLLVARLAWMMLFGSVFLYGAIAYLTIQDAGPVLTTVDMKPLRIAMTFAASFAVGLSFFRPLWAKALPRLGRSKQGANPEEKLLVLTLIHAALSEAAALYGMILAMVSHRMADFYPLAAISLVALLFHYPRAAAWEAWKDAGF